jgi:prolyl-tRNA synthetase
VLDADDSSSPGWKFAEWEMRGTPVRIELGPRDMEAGKVILARRDTGEKIPTPVAEVPATVRRLLDEIQVNLRERARSFREANTKPVADMEGMLSFFGKEGTGTEDAQGGFADALWCGSADCEAALKAKTKATLRCMPLGCQEGIEGKCALCGAPAKHRALFARNY